MKIALWPIFVLTGLLIWSVGEIETQKEKSKTTLASLASSEHNAAQAREALLNRLRWEKLNSTALEQRIRLLSNRKDLLERKNLLLERREALVEKQRPAHSATTHQNNRREQRVQACLKEAHGRVPNEWCEENIR